MRLDGWKLMLPTIATSGALVGLLAARRFGVSVPPAAMSICGSLAIPMALAAGVQRLVCIWRGPSVVSFSRLDAARCGGAEAGAIRAAAQLRGTLGGAGHVHRWRLALHALACFAAAFLGVVVFLSSPSDEIRGWLLALVAGAGACAALLPARPFYYREAMNGEIVVSPPLVLSLIAFSRPGGRSEQDRALATEHGVGRANSPSAAPTASNPAAVELQQEQ